MGLIAWKWRALHQHNVLGSCCKHFACAMFLSECRGRFPPSAHPVRDLLGHSFVFLTVHVFPIAILTGLLMFPRFVLLVEKLDLLFLETTLWFVYIASFLFPM